MDAIKAALGFLALLVPSVAAAQTVPSLPFATTPLAGNELLYIVQNNVNKKVTASALASGTSISYPPAGVPVSTGTAWASSITLGSGVQTGLGLTVNATGGFLTWPASTTVNGQTCSIGGSCTISAASSLVVGSTTITSGTSNGLLYNSAGVLGNLATANSGVLITNGSGVPSVSTTLPSSLSIPSPAFTGTVTGAGTIPLSILASQSANIIVGTTSAGSPTALSAPSCSAAGNALTWASGTGLGCATGYITGNQTITLTGDTTGSGATAITTSTTKIGGVAATLGGAFTMSGAFTFTGTVTANTTVTFPTSGTLLTTTGNGSSLTGLTYSQLPTLSANQVLGALTATTPSGLSVPSCSGSTNALIYTSGTGFGCNTISAGTGTVTTTGSPTSGELAAFSGSTSITNGNLSGDVTTTNTLATTVGSIGGKAVSLGGAFTMSGAFSFTGTLTAATTVTFPTSGTLLTTTGNGSSLTGLTYSQLPALSANQLLGSLTATTPSGQTVPSCSSAGNALQWTSGTGFGCATGYITSAVTTFSAGTTGFTPNTATSGAITLAGTLVAANGGTGLNTSSSTGVAQVSSGTWSVSTTLPSGLSIPSPTFTGTVAGTGTIPLSVLASEAANTVVGALTATNPSALAVPSCSAAGNALIWTSGTGFGCASGYIASAVTTFSAGTTGLTPNTATSGAVTLAGTLAAANGGTGISTAASTGVPSIASGVWSVASTLSATLGGTGQNSSAATGVPYVTSGAWAFSNALPSAVTATTQTGANNSTSLATTAYVDVESGLTTQTTINTTGGTTTLTAAQYATPIINVTGALTSAATLVMPNSGDWKVQNNTTGNFTLTVKTASGTGTTVSQTYSRHLLANGTNVIVADSDYFSVGAYTNTSSGALDPFYGCLRKSLTGICRIVSFADSILTCTQITPCTYGPYNAQNSPIVALRNELLKSFLQYSTGLRVPFRLMPTATVDGGEGGYSLTSGTVSNTPSVTYGPGQTGYSLNGQALLQCTATCVLTINVGQGYRALNIYCVESASNTGWTVTVGGTSLGTACGTTSGTTTGVIQSFNNSSLTTATASSWSISGTVLTVTTVASGTFATGGVLSGTSVTGGTTILYQMTGATAGGAGTYALSASSTASAGTLTQTGGLVNSTFTLTSTGTSSFLGGYEAITTMGNVGVVVDNMGEGAISSAFWTQNSTALGWFNQLAGQVGLCIHEGGQNDSQNPSVVTPAQVVANFQTVATACNNRGAAFSFFIPTPYTSTTANQYAFIQLAAWLYGQNPVQSGAAAGTLPWDILTLSDAWPSEGFTGPNQIAGVPNFIVQDSAASVAQAVASGLLQAQDSQHPSDYGSCIITNFMFKHLFARNTFNCNYNQLTATPNNKVKLSSAQTNATTTFQTLCEGTAGTCATGSHPFQFPIVAFQTLNIRCHGQLQVSAAATVAFQIASTGGTASSMSQTLDTHPTATSVSDVTSLAQTAYSTAVTSASITTTATNLSFDYTATVTHVATANASAVLSVQAHPSTGTLTIQPDTYCIAE